MTSSTPPEEEEPSIASRVIEFILDNRGSYRLGVSTDSDLYEDLWIQGDDVEEFFSAFSERFAVSLGGLDLSGCFPGEYWVPSFLRSWLFRPERRIRVKHLVEVVESGRWPELEAVN